VFNNGIGARAEDISKGIERVRALAAPRVALARYATLMQLNHQRVVGYIYEFDMTLM
jgi:hypothetical protein